MMSNIKTYWGQLSPAVRLALGYVTIIMVITIGFSAILYHVSSTELARESRRPTALIPDYGEYQSYDTLRLQQLAESQRNLKQNLVLLNLATLLLAGLASYSLAKRTLRPIEEALEAQTRFTGDASHELRTPLTAMQTEIEVALRNKELTKDDAKKQLRSNLEEVGKLRMLADGLLQLARADGNGINHQSVRLQDAVQEAIDRVTPAAKLKHVTISLEPFDVIAIGDYDSLVELAVILLDNAVKYSDSKTTVSVTAEAHGKIASLRVADAGSGIKATDLPHIFDRFYRADVSRSKQQVDGYGLGLSIAQKIVELHDGQIIVASTPGKGSTFTVRLPLADV